MSVETLGMRPVGDGMESSVKYDNPAYVPDTLASNKNQTDSQNSAICHDEVKVDVTEDKSRDIDPNDDDDDYPYNSCERGIVRIRGSIYNFCVRHKKVLKMAIYTILILLYFAYFAYAMYYSFGDEGSWRLLGFTVFAILLIVLVRMYGVYKEQVDTWWEGTEDARHSKSAQNFSIFFKWFLRVTVTVAVVVYIIVDVIVDRPQNLLPVAGLAIYIIIFYVTSVNPARVNWHTVFWGMALQYIFALLILRTKWGYEMFKWLGDRVTEFLEYTTAGVLFLFGESYFQHFFAMKVLSIVVFFFTFISIMYYLGVMQAIVKIVGRFLAFCMGTSPAESINAAANIFVSMTEAPLMIRPFLDTMTKSELHAVMTGGFATIAGSVLGAYISFGVPANHLLSASVMSAPAALAISKLSYPETEKSRGSSSDYSKMGKAQERNIVEAASVGATASIKIVGAIAVNVLAFLSLLAFLNATLTWFGDRVGIEGFTFEFICSYLLYPVSYFMGTDTFDCRKVAELIGVKTFTNEFIAYGQLRDLINNRIALNNYTAFFNTTEWHWDITASRRNIILDLTGEVLTGGVISIKSEVIATYALCGFANFGSIGITLGGLGSLAPRRKTEISQIVVRAMICGNVACFLTACIAGLLYEEI